MKDFLFSFQKFVCNFVFALISISAFSQSISKPQPGFQFACASGSFASYRVNFNFAPIASFSSGNTFFLQLSDASGNFTTFTEVANSTAITSSPAFLDFVVPSNFVGGEGFRFRIRSTSPALLSPESDERPIYFQTFTNSFLINNGQPTATVCTGSSITFSIDNPTAPPTTFTNLSYRWYKNTVLIPGATSTSLVITTAGTYYCEINYGACSNVSSITRSQNVIVNAVAGFPTITIASSNGTGVAIGNPTTLSTVQNATYAYQWFKNGVAIPATNSFNYITAQPGTYYVRVNNTTCFSQSNQITLDTVVITSTSAVIPNVISPNNDGINDTWVIPAAYISGTDTEVFITDAVGKEVLRTKNYTNDWPTFEIEFKSANPVFYYIITPINQESKKGSLTIIK
jgi:gliding motility-associated-like protein